ncbi:hypothetical protein M9H77_06228 [Catharanthus roseus]|uniref:Uncharacterized protein n=1 Tax=Catharanthus roseus TaxID=4058 RepID=A0ACC0BRJ6_CATRO|nr:hypothetical protein M9H77_06228 [Catharanthus roseus]
MAMTSSDELHGHRRQQELRLSVKPAKFLRNGDLTFEEEQSLSLTFSFLSLFLNTDCRTCSQKKSTRGAHTKKDREFLESRSNRSLAVEKKEERRKRKCGCSPKLG